MSALVVGIGTGIIDGAHGAQRLENHVSPLLLGVVLRHAEDIAARAERGGADAEVVLQPLFGVVADGSAEVEAILHDGHHAHGMRQLGHGVGLGLAVVAHGVGVAHVGPVKAALGKVHRVVGAGGRAIRHAQRGGALSCGGPLVVVQNLSRGRGHASHHAVAGVELGIGQQRTGVVEGFLLSPLGAEQGAHVWLKAAGIGAHHACLLLMGHIVAGGLVHGREPPGVALGLTVGIVALVRKGDDGGQQVVGSDDGEAALGIAHDGEQSLLLHRLHRRAPRCPALLGAMGVQGLGGGLSHLGLRTGQGLCCLMAAKEQYCYI